MRILIVEDEGVSRDLIALYLQSVARDLHFAETLDEAKRALTDGEEFHLITVDLDLPDSKGFTTLTEIVSMSITKDRKPLIIVVSGQFNQVDAEKLLQLGADACVDKNEWFASQDNFLLRLNNIVVSAMQNPDKYKKILCRLDAFSKIVSAYLNKQVAPPKASA